eukprot:m.148935 g.148935  ORF g.148935 m.148935 type:complete len:465 (+) comp30629_c1_seq2:411-1805(+)
MSVSKTSAELQGFPKFRKEHEAEVQLQLEQEGAKPTRGVLLRELASRWKNMPEVEKLKYGQDKPPQKTLLNPDPRKGLVLDIPVASVMDVKLDWHPAVDQLKDSLLSPNCGATPAAKRMRAIYYLRSIGSKECIQILCDALVSKKISPPHSTLIRHEIAYVLGQLRTTMACVSLEQVLRDQDDDVMVRHECAEALGAIGSESSVELLSQLASPSSNGAQHDIEIRQTCEVARDFCIWKASGDEAKGKARPVVACACMISPYSSHDPAPADPSTDGLSDAQVGEILRDGEKSLFTRYGAMFALRNRGGIEAVTQLGQALVEDTTSALLRHEVAFVLGQMQHPAALQPLATSLARANEHTMVRHESAEALGALDFSSHSSGVDKITVDASYDRCRQTLQLYSNSATEPDQAVRESCEVALDATGYWINNDDESEHEADWKNGFAQQKAAFDRTQASRVAHFNIKSD